MPSATLTFGQEGMVRFYQQLNERPPMTSLESDLDDVIS
jgi:hypothetical protein